MAEQLRVPLSGRAFRLDEVTQQLHQGELALAALRDGLAPLLDALKAPQRTRELESAAWSALEAGQQLLSAYHQLVTARAAFASEAALEARARMLVATSDGEAG